MNLCTKYAMQKFLFRSVHAAPMPILAFTHSEQVHYGLPGKCTRSKFLDARKKTTKNAVDGGTFTSRPKHGDFRIKRSQNASPELSVDIFIVSTT